MIGFRSVGHSHKLNANLQICTFGLHIGFIIFICEGPKHLSLKKVLSRTPGKH